MANMHTLPYKILTALLYGEFSFLDRQGSMLAVPTTEFCRHFKTTPHFFRTSLEFLADNGFISEFNWHRYSAVIRLKAPLNMGVVVKEVAP